MLTNSTTTSLQRATRVNEAAPNQVAMRQEQFSERRSSTTTSIATVANASGGMARLGIQTAKGATDFAFETAKISTRFGLSIAKGLVGGLGITTAPIEIAEFLALTGIEIGHGVTSMSLHGTGELIRVIQQFFGDPFALELARSVLSMVSVEIKKTGVEMGMFEMWRYFSAWVTLQQITKERWKKAFIFPNVSEMPIIRVNSTTSFSKSFSSSLEIAVADASSNQSASSTVKNPKSIWKTIKHTIKAIKPIPRLPDVQYGQPSSSASQQSQHVTKPRSLSIDKALPLIPVPHSKRKSTNTSNNSYSHSRFSSNPHHLLPFLKHFVKFGNGCYGERALNTLRGQGPVSLNASERHFYASYTGIDLSDVRYMSKLEASSDVFNSEYQPRFVISVDHAFSTVILAFRGTLSARDVVVDLASEPLQWAVGDSKEATEFSVHGGMLKVIAKCTAPGHSSGIYERVKEVLLEYPEYSLTLTGHSLGAGLAAILGVLWACPERCRTRKESGLPDREVQVVAIACPSVMDEQLGAICEDLILTVVIGWDWLARVSHAGVLEIRDAAIQLKNAEAENPGLLDSILSGRQHGAEEVEKLYDLRSTIALMPREGATYDKVHPPGKIIWIYKSQIQQENDEGSASCEKYAFYDVHHRAPVFGEVYFDEWMMKHHQPTSYDEILDSMSL